MKFFNLFFIMISVLIIAVSGCTTTKYNYTKPYGQVPSPTTSSQVIPPTNSMSPSPSSYTEVTTQASNGETVPYPMFWGHGSSYETESWSTRKDNAKELWGKNWWVGYSSHTRYQYRKTNSVRSNPSHWSWHRHYHWRP